MDFNEFNRQYKLSRASLIAGDTTDLDAVQTHLRTLAAALTGNDQEVAHKLIHRLPATVAAAQAPPPPPSPEMLEARRIVNEGKFDEGTREERLAALAEARRRIWELADRGTADSVQIRSLSRGLETSEDILEEGLPWDPPPDNRGS
ncbi:hypothetical protein EV138_7408 [Kribbella voronezhensis]|uniref:Uncharacterized protein n=1 Tax=Kribbella voronezhensis TaxID=2512212 RepID=A0A4R7STV9_9ACTN|nr:hypothetical protein [Kribbella voronezhensis]TDU82514.1 hypothetical protein EV138_7408 [Kribbella voronezhensis]